MMICIYTFKAFSISIDIPKTIDFVCFKNELSDKCWIQRQLPDDILSFSEIRQEKILKILPWKYLTEYDYAIWVSSEKDILKALLLLKNIEKNLYKDVYLFPEDSISKDTHSILNQNNLNVKSQLQKYKSLSKYNPSFFHNTDCIAFNVNSMDFKEFSIKWMNETLKESLNDEVSFSWLLSFSSLNVCECRYEVVDADCFFKIVIPNYNNGYELEKCLDSILSQSFRSFKIVIVDDCSTDNSLDIAKRYAENYPDIVFLTYTNERSYSGKARNVGIDFKEFTSKYTWFVDGDDILYKDSVLKDLYEKASITNADLISFDCVYVKDNKPKIHKFSIPDFSSSSVLDQLGIAPWHRIIKTEKAVYFFENCTRRQDLATIFRQYANCNTFAHLDKVCYIYHLCDYAKLVEPIWSIQNVYCTLIDQSRSLPEKYSKAILAYLEKYPKIFGDFDYDKIKSQVVVAMASYPLRKKGMLSVFKQLFKQCDYFCVYLNEYQEIPQEFMKIDENDKKRLSIEILSENLKDYGKFFWFKKFQGYYLTVDDDLDYPENYCKAMISKLEQFKKKAVVGMHGNDFDVVDSRFVVKKHCHAFLAEEKYDVPIDCIGTGAAAFYPENLDFSFLNVLRHFRQNNDLDISISILCKENGAMIYRIASEKNFVKMNGQNFINPLADIHFAWEKRYVQYDFWLHKDKMLKKCAFSCIRSNEVDFMKVNWFDELKRTYAKEDVDFYVIPIEDKKVLDNSNNLFFAKFEFVKKFLNHYSVVSIHPLKEKEVKFDFTRENVDEIFRKIEEFKVKNPKRISDRIFAANLKM